MFWYFQFQRPIPVFSDNPLKLRKIPCRGQVLKKRNISDITGPYDLTMALVVSVLGLGSLSRSRLSSSTWVVAEGYWILARLLH